MTAAEMLMTFLGSEVPMIRVVVGSVLALSVLLLWRHVRRHKPRVSVPMFPEELRPEASDVSWGRMHTPDVSRITESLRHLHEDLVTCYEGGTILRYACQIGPSEELAPVQNTFALPSFNGVKKALWIRLCWKPSCGQSSMTLCARLGSSTQRLPGSPNQRWRKKRKLFWSLQGASTSW